ncbi:MAG TPA: HEAT repeat domain-containing protein [Candidatus Binataceae bacterium]
MIRSRMIVAGVVWGGLFLVTLLAPIAARAQSYGGEGLGSATSNSPMMHQGVTHAGVDDLVGRAQKETPFKIIKDVKLGLKDADPNARVSELVKLRYLQDPEVNTILVESMSDRDIRVKMKAIDILGAREANEAVPSMSQLLFLRSTEPVVKLHLASALGRIGDAQGCLPVVQYLNTQTDERARGTAVFALGEIGSDKATTVLTNTVAEDESPMVRRLAKEALQKIDGELPTEHAKQVATQQKDEEPTDQKLQKIRELDQKMQDEER